MSLFSTILGAIRPTKHCWKETRRETLGHFKDYGLRPTEITTIYRIGIHEECLLTGDKRIRVENSLFPEEA